MEATPPPDVVMETGTDEDNVDQGLVVPEKLDESSEACQKYLGSVLMTVVWVVGTMLGPTPNVTFGLEFFMKKAPMSSRSMSVVSILWGAWFKDAKVGWKLVPVMDAEVEDELTKRVLLDPLGNSVLITVAFGGGAGVVIVQVAGLEYENKYINLKTFQ